MKTISVEGVSNPYNCIIGKGAINLLPEKISALTKAKKILIITDDNVDSLYGEIVLKLITDNGFECIKYVFPNGENHKNLETVSDILEFATQNEISRSDCIVALGGGIVGDTAGFCASVLLRGIDFIQVPTTFLSAIDSSVGGKTGVNLKQGKNLAGAFYQPKAVICDTDFLSTLTPDIFSDGTAEAIKYGVIFDKELFRKFSTEFRENIDDIISRCIELKADIVKQDEFDTGLRQLLNFGHTIGHAIEKCSDYNISHGKAIAIGMVMASEAGYKLGISKEDCSKDIISVLKKNNLPYKCDFSPADLLSVMLKDKKRTSSHITLVLPEEMGKCILYKCPVDNLENFVNLAFGE